MVLHVEVRSADKPVDEIRDRFKAQGIPNEAPLEIE